METKTRTKVLNPLTKRFIYVNSATYNKLVSQGISFQGAKKKQVKPFQPPTHYQVTKQFQPYPVDTSTTLWREKKPERVPERRQVMEKCGKSCFLMPEKLAFPICNKNPPPCEYNRKGINAAYVRAKQWKYEKVAQEIETLRKKLGLEPSKKNKRKQ